MCQPTCTQCNDAINLDGAYALRNGVYTCEECEWPQKRTPEECVIKALQLLPEQGPLVGHIGKPSSLWRKIAKLLGGTTLTPQKIWDRLRKNNHPMLECVKMYDEGRVLPVTVVRLRCMIDTTQGFTDDVTYGPTYPIHPERLRTPEISLRIGKVAGYKRPIPPRQQHKRDSGTQHRCVCGTWVQADTYGYLQDGARRNLFGRHWCKRCASGHCAARTQISDAMPALFTTADSLNVAKQAERHHLDSPEGTAVQIHLVKEFKTPKARWANSGKSLPTKLEVRSLFTLFDPSPTNPRITGMLKPAHKQRLMSLGQQSANVCAQLQSAMG